mmetsp:Transcript_57193/g.100091  ORF Transcript_57193/g.100091 Transcript_57193/m.100091 type:complete len:387 (+) Transcript_57193:84-1244(+)
MGCSNSQAKEPAFEIPRQQIVGSDQPESTSVKQMKMDVIWDKAKMTLEREDDSKVRWKLSAPFQAKVPCELAVHFHCMEKVKNGFEYSRVEEEDKENQVLPSAFKKTYPVGAHVLTLGGEQGIDLQNCPLEIFWKYRRLGQGAESAVYPIVLSLTTGKGADCFQSVLYLSLTMDALNEAGVPMRLGQKDSKDSTQDGDSTYYCGRNLGLDRIPGSDGVCGPVSGPQCEDCKKAQAKLQNSANVQELQFITLLHKVFARTQEYIVHEMYGLAEISGEHATDGELCVICLSEPRTTAVIPCRHLCVCEECSVNLRMNGATCPICRGPVQNMANFKINASPENPRPKPIRGLTMPDLEWDERMKNSEAHRNHRVGAGDAAIESVFPTYC